jgi:hypothetical protein
MSNENNNRRRRVQGLARGAILSTLAALPLGGLILFFEITRPAVVPAQGLVAAELSTFATDDVSKAFAPARRHAVMRFKGVSAELSSSRMHLPDAHVFSASDAERVFAESTASLKTGFQSEFVTKEGRRVALRIVGRQPIADQALPDDERMMLITPASTAKLVSFVWGTWLYRVELEDKGAEPEVVVQKIL